MDRQVNTANMTENITYPHTWGRIQGLPSQYGSLLSLLLVMKKITLRKMRFYPMYEIEYIAKLENLMSFMGSIPPCLG